MKLLIVTLLVLPLRFFFLWLFTGLSFEQKMIFKAAAITIIVFSILSLGNLIAPTGQSALFWKALLNSLYFQAPLIFILLKIVYKYEWGSIFFITILWMAVQFPLNIFQHNLYGWLF